MLLTKCAKTESLARHLGRMFGGIVEQGVISIGIFSQMLHCQYFIVLEMWNIATSVMSYDHKCCTVSTLLWWNCGTRVHQYWDMLTSAALSVLYCSGTVEQRILSTGLLLSDTVSD